MNQTYHSDSRTHSPGGKILAKLCTYDTTVAMGACHPSPDNPVSAGLLISPLLGLLLHPVNVGHPLAQVIVCLFPLRYPVQLEEGGARVLVASASLVPNKYTLIV